MDTLPSCCLPLARLLTTEAQMSNRLVDNEEVEINVEHGSGGNSSPRRDDNDVGILTLSDSVTNSSLQGGGDTPMGADVAGTGDLGDGGLEEVSTYGNTPGYLPRSRFTGPTV